MPSWVDITAAANWEPRFYPYSTLDGCVWRYDAAEESASVYAFAGGEWVGPELQLVPPNDVMAASLPVLAYVGVQDLSATVGVRITCRLEQDVTLAVSGFHPFVAVVIDPTNTLAVSGYLIVSSEELSLGFYASGTEFIIEGACDATALQYITAIFLSYDVDNCGLHMNYTDNALTITKIEVSVDMPPLFWTDFLGCEETPF